MRIPVLCPFGIPEIRRLNTSNRRSIAVKVWWVLEDRLPEIIEINRAHQRTLKLTVTLDARQLEGSELMKPL